MLEITVIFIALTFLYALARVIARPRWPVHEHYAELEHELVERERPLLTSEVEAIPDEAISPSYSIGFDHINNFGFLTYVVKVTRHDARFLPEGVTSEEFAPHVPQQNNQGQSPYITNTDLVIFRHRLSVHRSELVRAMFEERHAEDVLRRAKNYNGTSHLREIQHDDRTGELKIVFYLKSRSFGLKRGSTPEEFLAQAADTYDECISAALSYRPRHQTEAARWAEIFAILPVTQDKARAEILTHILKHHDRDPAVSRLCKRVLDNGLYTDQFVLFRHDPDRFFGAIPQESLTRFVYNYTRESDSFLTGPRTITPERFPVVFGEHLPFDVILNSKIPTVYRVELVRWWLRHDTRDRAPLHEAIASMSKRDQLQLRAALESDNSLSGALSSTDEQGGKLTLEP